MVDGWTQTKTKKSRCAKCKTFYSNTNHLHNNQNYIPDDNDDDDNRYMDGYYNLLPTAINIATNQC